MKRDICGVIACRGGSVRVPNKNIRPFADSSLLEIKVKQLKCLINKVYVNSESDDILLVAEACGAIPIKRDAVYSTNTVSINDVYKEVTKNLPHDHILFAHVTSPLITTNTINECISVYNNLPAQYDSVCTVQDLKKFIWYNGKSINYEASRMPRSQDLPNYHAIAFAINILPKETLINLKNIVTPNYYPFVLDELESVDIDTPLEFEIGEFLYKKHRL